jgi:hypothetical protein
VKGSEYDAQLCHLLVANLGPCWVYGRIKFRLDAQPLAMARCGNELHDDFLATQWLAAPIFADEEE